MINKIKDIFKISHEGQISFSYLGLQMKQTSICIEVDQHDYISEVQPIMIDRKRIKETKKA